VEWVRDGERQSLWLVRSIGARLPVQGAVRPRLEGTESSEHATQRDDPASF